MRKREVVKGLMTLVVGLLIMVLLIVAFKYMPWRIDGDKWMMCAMLEGITATITIICAASYFYNESSKKGAGRNG